MAEARGLTLGVVISPSSKLYDCALKRMIYEQAGVPEYWLVDEDKQTIELFALEGRQYRDWSKGVI